MKIFCEFCGEAFQDFSEVSDHLKNLHLDMLRCLKCGKKGLDSALLIYQHIIIRHEGEVPKIDQTDNSTNKFYCSKCGKGFKKITDHFDHVKFLHENDNVLANDSKILDIIFCDRCGIGLKSYIELHDHCKLEHSKGHQCLICFKESFKSAESIYIHYTESHEPEEVIEVERLWQQSHKGSVSRLYYCNKCGKGFYSVVDYLHHSKHNHENEFFICCVCDFLTQDHYSLLQHYADHFSYCNNVTCRVCNSVFNSVASYDIHRREHSQTIFYPCNICDFENKKEIAVRRHWLDLHFDEFFYKIKCDHCNIMLHPHEYKRHQTKHKIKCKKCDKELCCADLHKHIQNNHPSDSVLGTSVILESSTATKNNTSVVNTESYEDSSNIAKSVNQLIHDVTDTHVSNAPVKEEIAEVIHETSCLDAKVNFTMECASPRTSKGKLSENLKKLAKKTEVISSENTSFKVKTNQLLNTFRGEDILSVSGGTDVEILENTNSCIVISDDEDPTEEEKLLNNNSKSTRNSVTSSKDTLLRVEVDGNNGQNLESTSSRILISDDEDLKQSKTLSDNKPESEASSTKNNSDSLEKEKNDVIVRISYKRCRPRKHERERLRALSQKQAKLNSEKETGKINSVTSALPNASSRSSSHFVDFVSSVDDEVKLEKLQSSLVDCSAKKKGATTTDGTLCSDNSCEIYKNPTEAEVDVGDSVSTKPTQLSMNKCEGTGQILRADDSDVQILESSSTPIIISNDNSKNTKTLSNVKAESVEEIMISNTVRRDPRRGRPGKRDREKARTMLEKQMNLISENETIKRDTVNPESSSLRVTQPASKTSENDIISENNNSASAAKTAQSNKQDSEKTKTDPEADNSSSRKEAPALLEETTDNTYSPLRCEECKKMFLNSVDRDTHYRSTRKKHARGKYGCDICTDISFDIDKGEDEALIHIYKHEIFDSGRDGKKCAYCPAIFDRRVDVAKHEYEVHSKRPSRIIKDLDDFITAEYKVFEKVAKGEMKEPLWCTHCITYFESKQDLISHKQFTRHGMFIKCNICDYRCNRRRIDKHMQRHINSKNEQPSNDNDKTQCASCKRNFMTNKDLKHHLLCYGAHDIQKYVCYICKKTFSTDPSLVTHMREHDNVLNDRTTCFYCFKKFQMPYSLAVHESKAHPASMTNLDLRTYISEEFKILSSNKKNDKAVWCPECNSCFESKKCLIDHKQETKHGETKACQTCNVEFYNDEKYKVHRKVHELRLSGRQKCLFCDAMTGNKSLLADHEVRNHAYLPAINRQSSSYITKPDDKGEGIAHGRDARCKECKRLYMSEQDLNFHRSRIGTRNHFVNKYSCNSCNNMFNTETKLYSEITKHEIEKNPRKKCLYCSMSFKDYKSLAMHETSFHNKTPTIANIELFLSSEFKTLEQISKGEAPEVYWCPQCNAHFEKIDLLIEHKNRRKHGVVYKCNICDKIFYEQSKLVVHTVHHEIENSCRVKCNLCDVIITDNMKLARHQVYSHENKKEKPSSASQVTKKSNEGASGDKRAIKKQHLQVETQTGDGSDKTIKIVDLQVKHQVRDKTILNTKENRASNNNTPQQGTVTDVRDKDNRIGDDLLEEGEIVSHNARFGDDLLEEGEIVSHNATVTKLCAETLNPYVQCISCPKRFLHENDMISHCKLNKRHTMPKYECNKCGEQFNTDIFFKIHMYNYDVVASGRSTCTVCHQSFHELAEHEYTIHSIKPKFDKNLDLFKSKELTLWENQGLDKFIWCPGCDERFENETDLISHKSETNHGKVYTCRICAKTYYNENTCKIHLIQHDILDSRRVKCYKCSERYSDSWELAEHEFFSHKEVRNKVINTKSKSDRDTKSEEKSQSSGHARETNLIEKPKETNREQESPDSSTQKEQKKNKSESVISKNTGESSQTVADTSEVIPNKENFEATPHLNYEIINSEAFCDCCLNRYVSPSDAEIHIQILNPTPDQHTCRICYFKFSEDMILRKHLYEHILTQKNATRCSVCRRKFTSIQSLAIHEYDQHPSIQEYISTMNIKDVSKKLREQTNVHMTALLSIPYSCPFCNCTFPLSEDVLHHKETSCLSVTCQICSAPLKGKAQIDIHMIQHDILTSKRTCCRHCGYNNTNIFNLATHEHSHTLNVDTAIPCAENSESLHEIMRLSEELSHPIVNEQLLVYNPLHQFSQPMTPPYVPGLFVQPNFQVPFVPPYGYPQMSLPSLGSQLTVPAPLLSSPPVVPLQPPYVSEDLSPSTTIMLNNLNTFKQMLLANLRNTDNLRNSSLKAGTSVTIEEVLIPESSSENMRQNVMPSCDNKTGETNETSDKNTIETNKSSELQVIESQQINKTVDDIGSSNLTETLDESISAVAIENPQLYLRLRQDLAIDPFMLSNDTHTGKDTTIRDPAIENTQNNEHRISDKRKAESAKRKRSCDRSHAKSRREKCSSRDRSSTTREREKSRDRETVSSESCSKRRRHRERSKSKDRNTKSKDLHSDNSRRNAERVNREKSKQPTKENWKSNERSDDYSEARRSQLSSYDTTVYMPIENDLGTPLPPIISSSLNEPVSAEYPVITKPEDIDIYDETILALLDNFENSSTSTAATSTVISNQKSYAASISTFDENVGRPLPTLKECYACGKVFIKDVIDNHECSGPF